MRYELTNVIMVVCSACGAAVSDRDKHDEWHDTLERTRLNAQYAWSMVQPMGGM